MQEIITFIQNVFEKSKKTTAVIALSGGIDSATSLFLTVKAVGADYVQAFHLPAKNSDPIHLKDARLAAQAAGLPDGNFQVIPIGSMIQKSWRIIQKSSTKNQGPGTRDQLRLANMAARIRMMVIYDQAKKYDGLVVGTENYSEHLLGYFTRFGDEASDLEPIRHLYKWQVKALAQELGVPQPIIDKPPSADLWKGQTDAGELGFTYEQADPILALIDAGKTKEEIVAAGFDEGLTQTVWKQTQVSAFKHSVPYVVKLI